MELYLAVVQCIVWHTMSRYPIYWVALLGVGFVSGCASGQMNRIDANRDIYETWPIDVRQAVLDGKVEPGMTPEMVTVAWGKPSEVVQQGGAGDEVWVYKKGGDDGTMMYPGGASYPGGMYPGAGYPGGVYPGTGSGVTIGTGRGGTVVGTSAGVGMGGMGGIGSGMGGVMGPGGMGTPIMTRPTPPEIREVIFRNGVVARADSP
jgi:hypothetical protein